MILLIQYFDGLKQNTMYYRVTIFHVQRVDFPETNSVRREKSIHLVFVSIGKIWYIR